MKSTGKIRCGLLILSFLTGLGARASIKSEVIEYKDGNTVLEGFMVYDDAKMGPRPVVLIVHQWMGLGEHEKNSAQRLAEQGYLAFAIDVYGKGVRPTDPAEAGKLAGQYKSDIKLLRQREKAALDFIAKNKLADSKRMVIMGYCFGGTGALEAARADLPVVAAVSFHGGLSTPAPQNTKKMKPKLLVMHGAMDPYVPAKEVEGFMKEMNDAKADYQFIAYSGAVHAFTQKSAGNDVSKGAAFNEVAEQRSWKALIGFLGEVAPVTK